MHDSRWYRKPSRTPADLSNELNMSAPLQGDSQAWMILESVPNVASTDKNEARSSSARSERRTRVPKSCRWLCVRSDWRDLNQNPASGVSWLGANASEVPAARG
jgi:hypothetical protein